MVDLGQESKRLTAKVIALPESKLKSSAASMAAMVEGITTMAASMEKVVEHTKHLKKETKETEKATKGLVRKFSQLSEQTDKNPFGESAGKQWMVLRRLSSGTRLWAIQNTLVGVMKQTGILLDFFGGEGTGNKFFDKIRKGLFKTNIKLKRVYKEEEAAAKIRAEERKQGISFLTPENEERKRVNLRKIPKDLLKNMSSLADVDRFYSDRRAMQELGLGPKRTPFLMDPKANLREKFGDMKSAAAKKNKALGEKINNLWFKRLKGDVKLKKFREGISKIKPMVIARTFMRLAGMFFKFIFVVLAAVFIFKAFKLDKVLKGIWDTIVLMVKAVIFGVSKIIEGGGNILGGIMDLYYSFNDILNEGNWKPFLDALWRIGKGVLQVVGGIIWTVLGPIIDGIWGLLKYTLYNWVTSFWGDAEHWWQKTLILIQVGVTAMLAIAAFWAAPTYIVGIIAAAVVTAIGFALGRLIPGRSMGGPASGLTLVGEKGPELVNLPSGSNVYSNSESKRIATGMTNNITVNVQGRIGASDSELREIAQKVGRMINLELNRTTSTRTRGV